MSASIPQSPAPPTGDATTLPVPVAAPKRARPAVSLPAWRSLVGWVALLPVLVLSAVLNTEQLSKNGYANVFYSAGVKAMLGSLHNFLFNSFDPGGLVTVDKPPLALWVQALSAKLFGFSPLSLLLPEALIGVLGVALLYAVMRRPFGQLAALGGALALAVFPSYVAVSRDNGVDPVLILLMILACGAALRAIRTGGWLPLLASATAVGLAFNVKTLAAYLVVPGIALGYLLCAPEPPLRRLLKLIAAGVVLGAVSFSWIALVEATPASQRPYVGGSTDNTELNLTFGYNGFGRVDGQIGGPNQIFVHLGAVAPFRRRTHTILSAKRTAAPRHLPNRILPDGHYANPTPFGGNTGPLRLFHYGLGGQGSWMLPFALFGLIALALSVLWPPRGPHGPEADPSAAPADPSPAPADPPAAPADASAAPADPSAGRVPVSWVSRARARLGPDSRFERIRRDERTAGLLVLGGWFLAEAFILDFSKGIVHPYYVSALAPGAAAMIGAGALAFAQFARVRDWRVLLLPLAVAGTVAGQLVLLHREHYAHWLPPLLIAGAAAGVVALLAVRRLAAPATALVLIVLLIAPAAFATTTWSIPVEGTFPAAGPRVAGSLGPYGITHHDVRVDHALMRYIDARHPTRRWEVLTVSSNTSAALILLGFRAGAVGGYSGTDPALDGPSLARLVARHEARYVVLGGAYSSRGGNLATKAVIRACHYIPSQYWLGAPRYSIYSLTLYDCAGAERRLTATG
ncbi:MAG TPA: glycosyltransferase family 39 protein [Solirubrobacteraceae bacterium]|jgi:4-amino-4-deoxy-L-arabinose transferase-like glycosyltransferase|nr:glycosyltransferase family 39 protein [Solirubrobacteraceae bacterium]